MKTLNVNVFCSAYYNSFIQVPDDMSLEEAIEYARKNIKKLPVVSGRLYYVEGSDKIDEENCDFS